MSSLFSTHSVASNALARVFNFSTEVEHSNSREKSTFLVTMIFLIYSKPVKHGQSSSGSYGLKAVLLKDWGVYLKTTWSIFTFLSRLTDDKHSAKEWFGQWTQQSFPVIAALADQNRLEIPEEEIHHSRSGSPCKVKWIKSMNRLPAGIDSVFLQIRIWNLHYLEYSGWSMWYTILLSAM